jgi:hypothetical protein
MDAVERVSTTGVRLRVVKVSLENLAVSMEHGVWGSAVARFRSWEVGDYIVFYTTDGVAALATVTGEAFDSNLMIWEGAIYPHRIPVSFLRSLSGSQRAETAAVMRQILRASLGSYGMRILKQSLLPSDIGTAILTLIQKQSLQNNWVWLL